MAAQPVSKKPQGKKPVEKKKMHPSAYSTAKTIQKRKDLNKKVMEELDL